MSQLLPIGDAAAEARRERVTRYISRIEDALPAQNVEVTAALSNVRDEPLNGACWAILSLIVNRIVDTTPDRRPWLAARGAVTDGEHMASTMNRIARENAPICDAHGPMADSTDPAVHQSHDGHRWHCPTAPNCRSSYWWIDGTHMERRGAR